MKIAYVVGGLWRHHPGLQAKILAAAQVWEEQGEDVVLVLYSEGRVVNSKGETLSKVSDHRVKKLESYYDSSLGKLSRLFNLRHQYAYLKEILADLKPDVVYTRYAMPFPGVRHVFGAVCPYVVEINSDDLVEYGLKHSFTGIYNRIFRKGFLQGAKGLSFISREMSISSSFNWFDGKKGVVANSIKCDEFPFTEETRNDHINICFIGSPNQSWHGLDKIQILCNEHPHWTFHIIGPDKKECLAAGIKTAENIIFHGYLSGDNAKELLHNMDVGISTLALHRKQMHEASPLKSRQYLAQGIPFISAYEDTDIPQLDCVYQLPNTELNVESNLERIGEFVHGAFENSKLRRSARLFAESNLDSYIVEKKRLAFIKSCI